jgi:hypothetical protein
MRGCAATSFQSQQERQMRNKFTSATARYLASTPTLLGFLIIGVVDVGRALMVSVFA